MSVMDLHGRLRFFAPDSEAVVSDILQELVRDPKGWQRVMVMCSGRVLGWDVQLLGIATDLPCGRPQFVMKLRDDPGCMSTGLNHSLQITPYKSATCDCDSQGAPVLGGLCGFVPLRAVPETDDEQVMRFLQKTPVGSPNIITTQKRKGRKFKCSTPAAEVVVVHASESAQPNDQHAVQFQVQECADANIGGKCKRQKEIMGNADIEQARLIATRRVFPDGEILVKVEQRCIVGKLSWTTSLRLGVRQLYSLMAAQAARRGIQYALAAAHILDKMVASMNGDQVAFGINYKALALLRFA